MTRDDATAKGRLPEGSAATATGAEGATAATETGAATAKAAKAGPRRTGASARGEETRALIIETAMDLFASQGYRATSVREIASRCGLTHPALLYHFPAKADLLMAVLTKRDQDDDPGVPFPALAGRALLDRLVETARLNAGRPGLVELFATLSAEATAPDHPAHAYFQARYSSLLAEVERSYREEAHAGRLRPEVDPATAARQLVALMDGLQVQWLLDRSTDMAGALSAQLATQFT